MYHIQKKFDELESPITAEFDSLKKMTDELESKYASSFSTFMSTSTVNIPETYDRLLKTNVGSNKNLSDFIGSNKDDSSFSTIPGFDELKKLRGNILSLSSFDNNATDAKFSDRQDEFKDMKIPPLVDEVKKKVFRHRKRNTNTFGKIKFQNISSDPTVDDLAFKFKEPWIYKDADFKDDKQKLLDSIDKMKTDETNIFLWNDSIDSHIIDFRSIMRNKLVIFTETSPPSSEVLIKPYKTLINDKKTELTKIRDKVQYLHNFWECIWTSYQILKIIFNIRVEATIKLGHLITANPLATNQLNTITNSNSDLFQKYVYMFLICMSLVNRTKITAPPSEHVKLLDNFYDNYVTLVQPYSFARLRNDGSEDDFFYKKTFDTNNNYYKLLLTYIPQIKNIVNTSNISGITDNKEKHRLLFYYTMFGTKNMDYYLLNRHKYLHENPPNNPYERYTKYSDYADKYIESLQYLNAVKDELKKIEDEIDTTNTSVNRVDERRQEIKKMYESIDSKSGMTEGINNVLSLTDVNVYNNHVPDLKLDRYNAKVLYTNKDDYPVIENYKMTGGSTENITDVVERIAPVISNGTMRRLTEIAYYKDLWKKQYFLYTKQYNIYLKTLQRAAYYLKQYLLTELEELKFVDNTLPSTQKTLRYIKYDSELINNYNTRLLRKFRFDSLSSDEPSEVVSNLGLLDTRLSLSYYYAIKRCISCRDICRNIELQTNFDSVDLLLSSRVVTLALKSLISHSNFDSNYM